MKDERVLTIRFFEDKIEESEDFIKSLEEKRSLDSQQRLMLRAEKQEKRFYELALSCLKENSKCLRTE